MGYFAADVRGGEFERDGDGVLCREEVDGASRGGDDAAVSGVGLLGAVAVCVAAGVEERETRE